VHKILARISNHWPLALIAFGIMLTLVWFAVLVWFPLHLLDMVSAGTNLVSV
jgi:hypothetical protein